MCSSRSRSVDFPSTFPIIIFFSFRFSELVIKMQFFSDVLRFRIIFIPPEGAILSVVFFHVYKRRVVKGGSLCFFKPVL